MGRAGVHRVSDTVIDNLTLIRDKQVAAKLGVSLVTLWRMRQDPQVGFPQKIQISKGVGGTRVADLTAWLETRAAQ